MDARPWLEHLEASLVEGEPRDALPALALLAGQRVELDGDELHAALRRALLLLATGGDPRRGLELEGRAVRSLADDLASPEPAGQLEVGLGRLREDARGLPRVEAAVGTLLAEAELAWRAFACALLAEEVAEDE